MCTCPAQTFSELTRCTCPDTSIDSVGLLVVGLCLSGPRLGVSSQHSRSTFQNILIVGHFRCF